MTSVKVFTADHRHVSFANEICTLIKAAAKVRKTGIAERQPAHIKERINSGHAVIALSGGNLAGFCYIAAWQNDQFVSHSSLIVHPSFRRLGIAKRLKETAMELSARRYPGADVFGITTSTAVMKINHQLGYLPVAFRDLTADPEFWDGCQGCPNYDILQRNERSMCLCTGMLAKAQEPLAYDLSHSILKIKANE